MSTNTKVKLAVLQYTGHSKLAAAGWLRWIGPFWTKVWRTAWPTLCSYFTLAWNMTEMGTDNLGPLCSLQQLTDYFLNRE